MTINLHPLTKKELRHELKIMLDRYFHKIETLIDAAKLSKRLDRIAIGNKLISVKVDDLTEYIRLQNQKIQELEKRIEELEIPQRS